MVMELQQRLAEGLDLSLHETKPLETCKAAASHHVGFMALGHLPTALPRSFGSESCRDLPDHGQSDGELGQSIQCSPSQHFCRPQLVPTTCLHQAFCASVIKGVRLPCPEDVTQTQLAQHHGILAAQGNRLELTNLPQAPLQCVTVSLNRCSPYLYAASLEGKRPGVWCSRTSVSRRFEQVRQHRPSPKLATYEYDRNGGPKVLQLGRGRRDCRWDPTKTCKNGVLLQSGSILAPGYVRVTWLIVAVDLYTDGMQAYDYFRTGSDTNTTLRDNRQAFQRFRLVPRVMVNVSKIDLTYELLGRPRPIT